LDFQIPQSSVAAYLLQARWKSLLCIYEEISYESIDEISLKIGPHLPVIIKRQMA